ncbi:hypothetical protein TrRE_jg12722 [Triparma retinervis]|uniref:Uncharacterized protein n=1 Tax=Triparma retinervis TaxID=2557542 RepID=A0A9W6ZZU1_9STRA|nr:hypothetical protein TrRE_jg12722 [Triparma retinervis]
MNKATENRIHALEMELLENKEMVMAMQAAMQAEIDALKEENLKFREALEKNNSDNNRVSLEADFNIPTDFNIPRGLKRNCCGHPKVEEVPKVEEAEVKKGLDEPPQPESTTIAAATQVTQQQQDSHQPTSCEKQVMKFQQSDGTQRRLVNDALGGGTLLSTVGGGAFKIENEVIKAMCLKESMNKGLMDTAKENFITFNRSTGTANNKVTLLLKTNLDANLPHEAFPVFWEPEAKKQPKKGGAIIHYIGHWKLDSIVMKKSWLQHKSDTVERDSVFELKKDRYYEEYAAKFPRPTM